MWIIKRIWRAVFDKRPQERRKTEGAVDLSGVLVAHELPRDLQVNVSDDIPVQASSYGIHRHGGEEESVRIVEGEDQEIWSDVNSSGLVRSSIRDASPQGESGSYEVCRILIEKINEECKTNWGELEDLSNSEDHPEEGVDCRAYDGVDILDIQVTRAETGIWKDLNQKGKASWDKTVEAVADDIWRAIEEKSKPIPAFERKGLVLALNALETSGSAFQQVVAAFQDRHGSKAKSLGYIGIWIVGNNTTLARRLD